MTTQTPSQITLELFRQDYLGATDQDLENLAKERGQSLDKTIEQVATGLVRQFSENEISRLHIPCKALRDRCEALPKIYDAVFTELNLGTLSWTSRVIQSIFAHYSWISNKTNVYKLAQRDAVIGSDRAVSFSDRCKSLVEEVEGVRPLFEMRATVSVDTLFKAIEGEIDPVPEELGPFFFKHTALPGETWADLAREWATKTEQWTKLDTVIEKLPLNKMVCHPNVETFQHYLCRQITQNEDACKQLMHNISRSNQHKSLCLILSIIDGNEVSSYDKIALKTAFQNKVVGDKTVCQLAGEWADAAGQRGALERFNSILAGEQPVLKQTFQGFVIEETYQAFIKKYDVQFNKATAKRFREEIEEDEAFRMELVFHMGESALVLPPNTSKAYSWLKAVQQFQKLKQERNGTFFSANQGKLFNLLIAEKEVFPRLFEEHFDLELSVDLESSLNSSLRSDTFQKNLAFYIATPAALQGMVPGGDKPWLLAIRRFLRFQNDYSFTKRDASKLFEWAYRAIPSEETRAFDQCSIWKEMEKKTPVGPYIQQLTDSKVENRHGLTGLCKLKKEGKTSVQKFEEVMQVKLEGGLRETWSRVMDNQNLYDEVLRYLERPRELLRANLPASKPWVRGMQRLMRLREYSLTVPNRTLVFAWILNAEDHTDLAVFDGAGYKSVKTEDLGRKPLDAWVDVLKEEPISTGMRFVHLLRNKDKDPKEVLISEFEEAFKIELTPEHRKVLWRELSSKKFETKLAEYVNMPMLILDDNWSHYYTWFLAIQYLYKAKALVSDANRSLLFVWILEACEVGEERLNHLNVLVEGNTSLDPHIISIAKEPIAKGMHVGFLAQWKGKKLAELPMQRVRAFLGNVEIDKDLAEAFFLEMAVPGFEKTLLEQLENPKVHSSEANQWIWTIYHFRQLQNVYGFSPDSGALLFNWMMRASPVVEIPTTISSEKRQTLDRIIGAVNKEPISEERCFAVVWRNRETGVEQMPLYRLEKKLDVQLPEEVRKVFFEDMEMMRFREVLKYYLDTSILTDREMHLFLVINCFLQWVDTYDISQENKTQLFSWIAEWGTNELSTLKLPEFQESLDPIIEQVVTERGGLQSLLQKMKPVQSPKDKLTKALTGKYYVSE